MDHYHQPPPPDKSLGVLSMANKGGIPSWDDREGVMLVINGGVQPGLLEKCNEWGPVLLIYVAEDCIDLTKPTRFKLYIINSDA